MTRIKLILSFVLFLSLASCTYVKEKKDQWFGEEETTEVVPAEVESVEADSEAEEDNEELNTSE
jgi:hypothetical protein